MKILLFISVFILILIFGCKEDAVTEPTEYEITISGKVVGEYTEEIENSEVFLITEKDTISVLTNFEGLFSFTSITTELDSAIIIVKKDEYEDKLLVIENLLIDPKQSVTIELKRSHYLISGTLTELDESGFHYSAGTEIQILLKYHYHDTVKTKTNLQGEFTLLLSRKDFHEEAFQLVQIIISKPDFPIIDTFIRNNYRKYSITNINLQLVKMLNYFPIKAGNKWEYDIFNYTGDSYARKKEGTEFWEITSVKPDGKSFNMDIYFTGTLVFVYGGIEKDTTFFERQKRSYTLNISKDGFIETDDVSDLIPAYFKRTIFLHPATNGGIVNFENGSVSYTLFFRKGISKFRYNYCDGSWVVDDRLSLISFTVGE